MTLLPFSPSRILSTVLSLAAVVFVPLASADSVTVIHHFSSPEHGSNLAPGLADGLDGRLYGVTRGGGTFGKGTLFSIRPNGSQYRTIFTFDGDTTGLNTEAVMLGSNGRLFGTSLTGPLPDPDPGSLFSVKRDGSGFEVLHRFNGFDGEDPSPYLVEDNAGVIYGTTEINGEDEANGIFFGEGTVFALNLDGSGFRVLKVFSHSDGASPANGVVLATDGRLYGTTDFGGAYDSGTLFSLARDGTGFTVHREFGAPGEGGPSIVRLLAGSDGFVYGSVARAGGVGPYLYRFLPGGLNFTVILDLSQGPGGWGQFGPLTEGSDGRLHGTVDGANGSAIFAVQRDGTGFVVQAAFGTGADEPDLLHVPLLPASNGWLYAGAAGGLRDGGVLLGIDPDGSDLKELRSFEPTGNDGSAPVAGVVYARDGRLYGLARNGGAPIENAGTFYSLKPNGTGFKVHHRFGTDERTGTNTGSGPEVALTEGSNGWLYGSTPRGGEHGNGTLFYLRPGTGKLNVLHQLTIDQGRDIGAPLVEGPNGILYGVARQGGLTQYSEPNRYTGVGTVFAMHRTGTNFMRLHAMNRQFAEGDFPEALAVTRTGQLFGFANSGGSVGGGTVFRLDRDGDNFEVLSNFFANSEFGSPSSVMRASDDWLFATTQRALLRVHRTTLGLQPIHVFTTLQNLLPRTTQLFEASDGRLYGATGERTGANDEGMIFSIDRSGRSFFVHYDFGGATAGMAPRARFTEGPDGKLYNSGMGGDFGLGVVFALQRELQIIESPGSRVVQRKEPLTLFVAASGPGPLYYHWYRNGKLLRKSSENTFDLGPAAPGDAGDYHVVVKNRNASVTSATATIVVQ